MTKATIEKQKKELITKQYVSICIDLNHCSSDLIRSEVHIREYIEKICELLEIKTYGVCHIVHLGEDINSKGYSVFQLLDSFSISGHFIEKDNTAHIDIFSYKPINEEQAGAFTQDFFEAKYSHIQKNIRR